MNELLEASAGTGKTYRIAERFLALVADDGIDVRRIVVVTFTEAATSELRHRIRRRLRNARGTATGERDARLRAALEAFDEAQISTIHAFCQRMLRRHAFESGAGFHVELAGDVGDLLDDVVSDFWTRLTFAADPAMLPALEAAGITRDLLTDLARKARNPDLPVIPEVAPTEAPDVAPWSEAVQALRSVWKVRDVLAAIDRCDMVRRSTLDHPESFPERRTSDFAREVSSALWKTAPTEPAPAWMAYFRAHRLAAGTRSGTAPHHAGLDALEALAEVHEQLREPLLTYVQGVKLRLVAEVRQRLPARLRAQGLRTWDDLLRELRDALRDPDRGAPLVQALRSHLDLALIDEFQDTDPVQWEIFSTLFPHELTLIGDPKQAIYGFRGADVTTYRRAAEQIGHTRTLDVNYRSDESLVLAINHLFGREGLTRPFGADWPRFSPVSAHHRGSSRDGDDRPALEVRFLPRRGARTSAGILDRSWLGERLPDVVAADVVAELERGVSPGDCAVLVRSNDQARAVAGALRRRGVPAVRRSDDSVWRSPVATELATVLAAVREPAATGPRRAALLTSLLGRNADDVYALDSDDHAATLLSARFHRWHELWVSTGFAPMFQDVLDTEDVLARLLGADGGQRAAADLLHLAELLDDASRRAGLGPTALLSWLHRGGPGSDPEATSLRLATDDPAVQVVTVHSAKGLEYPFVWCPWLWSGGFVTRKDQAHLEFHDEHDRRTLDLGSPDHAAHLARRESEQLQEDLRLVYVAVTRARHRCVVYWGPATYTSALGSLLAGRPDDEDRTRHATDQHLLEGLGGVLEHEHIGLTEVDWGDIPAFRWTRRAPRGHVGVSTPTRTTPPDRMWRRTSFSALLRGVQPGDPTPHLDHDPSAEGASLAMGGERIPLADLPGGTRMGTFLHRVLELHDFTSPDTLRPLLDAELQQAGLDPAHADLLEGPLRDALRTPIVDDLCLEALPRAQRLDELEFVFPLRDDLVTVATLAEAFRHPDAPRAFADHVDRLAFLPVRGWMVGSIDLVFQHAGRTWLADYKSNHLGDTWADYGPLALEHEMIVSRYVLQAHLYAVALHRYLRWRLPDYDYERHFGGVRYLFLRGMHPDHATGVHASRPTAAFIAHLDEVLSC